MSYQEVAVQAVLGLVGDIDLQDVAKITIQPHKIAVHHFDADLGQIIVTTKKVTLGQEESNAGVETTEVVA